MTENDGTMDVIAFTRGLAMGRLMAIDESIVEQGRQWRQHRRLSCIRVIDIHRFHHFEALETPYPTSESIDTNAARLEVMAIRQDAAGNRRVARAAWRRDRDNLQVIHGWQSRRRQHQNKFLIPVKKSGSCRAADDRLGGCCVGRGLRVGMSVTKKAPVERGRKEMERPETRRVCTQAKPCWAKH